MNVPICSIDLIVQDQNGAILLGGLSEKWQDKGKYLWGLPGREIQFGETLKRCVERNLEEELGMTLVSAKIVSINTNFGLGNHYLSIGILVNAKGEPMVKKQEDWIEWAWYKKENLPSKLFPSAEKTLKSYLNKNLSLDIDDKE